jgi:hypothetical protein
MEMFDNSFWQSGYPIGIGILIIWWVVAKLNKKDI